MKELETVKQAKEAGGGGGRKVRLGRRDTRKRGEEQNV